MARTYRVVTLASRPEKEIIPDKTFKIEERPYPDESSLKDDEVIVEVLYLSLDPAMRGWLSDARSYLPPVPINGIMRGACVARVISSKSSELKAGDLVTGNLGWCEIAVCQAKDLTKLKLPKGARPSDALGVLGMTMLTAYFGLLDIGQPKKGDLVVVSGAAGATGSMVVQIALLKGARVVGIAGSDDKVAWLKELGCEAALNYKSPSFKEDFKKATNGFINIYFDNVGGSILDMALGRAAQGMRVVACGQISSYNSGGEPVGLKNIMNIVAQRIKMQGFIVFDYADRWPEALAQASTWLEEGKLQRKEYVIKGGLEKAPQGLLQLFNGENTGKMLVEVKSESAKL